MRWGEVWIGMLLALHLLVVGYAVRMEGCYLPAATSVHCRLSVCSSMAVHAASMQQEQE